MKPLITRARGQDAPELHRIALESKGHWGYPPDWLARFGALFQISPAQVEAHPFFCIRSERGIEAWSSLRSRGAVMVLEDLWVSPGAIGRGWGRALFEHALSETGRAGAERLELEADPNAVAFYLHMGAVVTGEVETSMGRSIPTMAIDLEGE